jgi:hypothetical protein
MISHEIQHYQTCFRVGAPDEKPLREIQRILFTWVCEKESDRGLHGQLNEFVRYGKWASLWGTKNSLQTTVCYDDNGLSWAMHFEERDKEHGSLRFWYTDVGLRKNPDEIVLSVRISYAWNQTDLTNFQIAPDTSVPRFVRSILNSGLKVYCGRPEFRLTENPVFLKLGFGKGIAEWIMSVERRYPILVFNGSGDALTTEAGLLAKSLAGKCEVLVLPEDRDLAAELRCYLNKDFIIPFNQFRVFFPLNPQNPHPARHRWYDVTSEAYPEQRKGIINGLLRNYSMFDREAVESLADVYRRVSQLKLEKFRKENPEREAEMAEFYEMLAEAEKERDYHKEIATLAATECDAKDSDIAELKRHNYQLSERIKQAEANRPASSILDRLKSLPANLSELLKIFEEHEPARLAITPDAFSSAKDYAQFNSVHEAWEMLHDLCRLVYEMKFKPPKDFSGDFENYFDTRSRYELTMTETGATKRDKALMELRQLTFEGKAFDITPHLKWGSKEPKLLRIHFAFDEDKKRIIVGFVGQHLPTAGTRKIC